MNYIILKWKDVPLKSLAIVGTVGVPASYGGFETLVENLIKHNHSNNQDMALTVWCSGKDIQSRNSSYLGAKLEYINLSANGVSSILYDTLSIVDAVRKRQDIILLLGVSGACALPLVRLFSDSKVVVNIDGMEWKRDKWGYFAKKFLKISEAIAVRFSHAVIADNQEIANYVGLEYGRNCHTVAYGGDHALGSADVDICESNIGIELPNAYSLGLCRIEPENNIHMILSAYAMTDTPLIFIGNWDRSLYGRTLKGKYSTRKNILLLDPIYDLDRLRAIREKASIYVHGHSAGGTNPSLVEMMHFGLPILAYDCRYNRYTTEEKAIYFSTSEDLSKIIGNLPTDKAVIVGEAMKEIANRRYTWEIIGKEYFKIFKSF